jgi:large subunit ribosomal protein L19
MDRQNRMHKNLVEFNMARRDKTVPELMAGDVVKIHRKIVEAGKERIQVFQGMVIAIKGGQSSSPMITVRKVSFGIGVEIVVPLYSPNIDKIEVVKRTRARRAKLYFVRSKAAKLLSKKLKEVALKLNMIEAPKVEEAIVEEEASAVEEAPQEAPVVEAEKVETPKA